jgi:drug/metabolite transporter (DMT)-like permease
MFPAFLAAVFFACSAVLAHRLTRLVGAMTANVTRIWVASGMLAAIAATQGGIFRGAGFAVFIASGVVGFGIGDLALFAAYPRLGSRLTMVMVQCLASPFGALVEWGWLGTRPTLLEVASGVVILAGVALAIAPAPARAVEDAAPVVPARPGERGWGWVCGVVAAFGQGSGAVISRKAYSLAAAAGQSIDGYTAAFQRTLGGVAVITIAYLVTRRLGGGARRETATDWRRAWPWVVATALAGATLGVGCYQWALRTTPSAVVLPIVALTPLVVVPLAWFFEHERPGARSLAGGAIAVAGAAALAWLR